MAKITEKFHIKRLNEKGISIQTTYFNDGNKYIKTTDNSINDSFDSGVRINKKYFVDGKIKYQIVAFDSRINYSFINSSDDNKEFNCPNCGAYNKVKEGNGCPYCGTDYNLDYDTKRLGSKLTYDTIVESIGYKIFVLITVIIASLLLVGIYRINVGRTFNQFDVLKISLYGIIIAVILYAIFYYVDALIVLEPLKRMKEKSNQKQIDFWEQAEEKGIDKNKFFNNFNYELGRLYYTDSKYKDVIDYDILDYESFRFIKEDEIEVKIKIRLITYNDKGINFKINSRTYNLKRSSLEVEEISGGLNMIKCYGCGASIDVTSNKCDHCGRVHNYLQEWYII